MGCGNQYLLMKILLKDKINIKNLVIGSLILSIFLIIPVFMYKIQRLILFNHYSNAILGSDISNVMYNWMSST